MLERLIKKDYLYTDAQLKEMKAQLRVIKEELAQNEAKKPKSVVFWEVQHAIRTRHIFSMSSFLRQTASK